MLVTSKKILQHAHTHGYAVPAFNINTLETLRSVVKAGEALQSPLIIQTSEGALSYAGMDYLKEAVYVAAHNARIPIALHLDHGKDLKTIRACIKKGWTSVMFDGSSLPFEENVKKTQQVVSWAHAAGISVEAELGALRGKEDMVNVAARDAHYTDPAQALEFVKKTKIDALAIAIGTAHGPFKFEGNTLLDFKRLAAIKKLVKMPLVLHGASGIPPFLIKLIHSHCQELHDCVRLEGAKGVSDTAIKKSIAHGINKVNIDSDLRIAFAAGIRSALLEHPSSYDPRELLAPAQELMEKVALQKIRLLGSSRL